LGGAGSLAAPLTSGSFVSLVAIARFNSAKRGRSQVRRSGLAKPPEMAGKAAHSQSEKA
jgi:hypothetical protein